MSETEGGEKAMVSTAVVPKEFMFERVDLNAATVETSGSLCICVCACICVCVTGD